MWTFCCSHFFIFSEVKVIKDLQTNEQIRDREVRLIGSDGAQLGIMSARQAQQIADDAHLDLVKISPNSVPPVCKVMDYGKYRYEQNKREKEARKNQKIVELKEIRLSIKICPNKKRIAAQPKDSALKSPAKSRERSKAKIIF